VAQGSLCTVLLVAAGLFVVSLHRVRTQDLGFSADGVLIAELRFNRSLPGPEQDAVYQQAAQRVARVPGVDVVSVNEVAPFIHHHVVPVAADDRPDFPDRTQQLPFLNGIAPTYFRALGMTVRAGRNFTPADRAGSPLVVIVNQAMADGIWPGASALGRCLRVGSATVDVSSAPCREVVGVVNNARPRSIREEAGQARMQYYLPYDQVPAPGPFLANAPQIWNLLIRTTDADATADPVQRVLQSFAPEVQLAEVTPLQDTLDRAMRPWLLGASLFSLFGVLALVLAAVGLYGVRAYAVAQRTQEIGIRIALGAAARNVVRMVLWEGVRVIAIAVVIGAAVALAVGHFLEPLLFETRAANAPLYGAIGLALVTVAVAASAIPAWRAARVDPNVALRAE
jgi:predicted permease